MKCKEIIGVLEELAPIQYAESWDNVGLLVGDNETEVKKIMIALDATDAVIAQAQNQKVNMLITHHPLIFAPINKINNNDFIGRRIISLIRNNITYYAMHTNFDSITMAQEAANLLKLSCIQVLIPNTMDETVGIGRFGYLEENITLEQCAELVKESFGLEHIKMIGDCKSKISLIAVSPGSGKSVVKAAIDLKADVLITGDIDHHTAIDAKEQGLCMIDGGHFGTEYLMVKYVKQYLEEYFVNHYNDNADIQVLMAKEDCPYVII